MIPDWELLASAFTELLDWRIMGLLLLGTLAGFVAGILPGFNEGNLMAIVLPFTVYLGPTGALVFMTAAFMAGQAGGSVPAILLNIPGTPSTAATCLEGYPLRLQGKAVEALGASVAASSLGGMIGTVFLFIITPIMGVWALRFSSPETFMLAVLGMTVVGALSGSDPLKGVLSAAFGLVFASIGLEYRTGVPRATFGIPELYDGIPLIPALLGLFGLSELLVARIARGETGTEERVATGWRKPMEGVKAILRYPRTIVRSGLIGTAIGALPGAGATIATFVSYGQARQFSKRPETFGKGSFEGLLATDLANNASVSGSLIPLLSLGVPGSSYGVILLAALFMHGYRPGPGFFSEFVVPSYVVFLSLFIVSALIFLIGFPIAQYLPRLVFISPSVLFPVVLILILLGGYAWRFYYFDVVLVIVFGVLGVLMRFGGYSAPAFLLALILGPLAEVNLLRSLRIGGWSFILGRPIVWVLVVLTVLSILVPLHTFRKSRGRVEKVIDQGVVG